LLSNKISLGISRNPTFHVSRETGFHVPVFFRFFCNFVSSNLNEFILPEDNVISHTGSLSSQYPSAAVVCRDPDTATILPAGNRKNKKSGTVRNPREHMMAVDFKPDPDNPLRTRPALSTRTKKKIKEMIGRCEYCNAEKTPAELEVHQFGALAKPSNRPDENPSNGFIVLCKNHYAQVCEGTISKFSLKSKISERTDKKKIELRSALQKCDRTYTGSNVTKVRDPRRFDVFLKDKDGRRRE
jgi:hypothetical protein